MPKLIIIGSGGLATEAAWVAAEMNRANFGSGHTSFEVLGFAEEDRTQAGKSVAGHEVLGTLSDVIDRFKEEQVLYFCAIGNNETRAKVVGEIPRSGWSPATLIHPSVVIGPSVLIREGAYIGAGSIICPNSFVGPHVVVNVHVSVGHDARLENFAQACPGVRLGGRCVVEEQSFLGSNATIAPGLIVGRNAKVAANTSVVRNVKQDTTVVGVPGQAIACPRMPSPAPNTVPQAVTHPSSSR